MIDADPVVLLPGAGLIVPKRVEPRRIARRPHRVGPGLDVLGARTSDEDYSKILPSLKRPHLDYLRDFYADTAMFGGGVHALRCGYEFFGADKVVFATDTPLGPIAPTIDVIKRLEIADGDRRKIFAGNAERLLKRKLS